MAIEGLARRICFCRASPAQIAILITRLTCQWYGLSIEIEKQKIPTRPFPLKQTVNENDNTFFTPIFHSTNCSTTENDNPKDRNLSLFRLKTFLLQWCNVGNKNRLRFSFSFNINWIFNAETQ